MRKHSLRLVLWDQLSDVISSLEDANPKTDTILFMETVQETTYVKHHAKKLAFFLSGMRHFADQLKKKGYCVIYISIEEDEESLTSGLERVCKKFSPERIVVTEPGEYRILKELESWKKKFSFPIEIRPDSRFFCSREEFQEWAEGRKKLIMENFYHTMRKKTGLLLEKDGEPVGGKWNYDQENRNPLREKRVIPGPLHVKPDSITQEVLKIVKSKFSSHFGELLPFWFATTHHDAQKAFYHFVEHLLADFGKYQDAMVTDEYFLYHSVISFYLNVGLLEPQQVCRAVEKAFWDRKVPLESAEGYIRQILGWREFIRGVYWLKMPEYKTLNFLEAKRRLPAFYWTGKTEMNCLRQAIEQTQKEAYAHHIQRLMITGNFALLIGVLPEEVCEWYLVVYADAHDWVELPNTLGMSQFADGGFLGTKPYCSSGNYIHKMSNYCESCHYKVQEKEGERACPFNYLYWDFLLRNQKKLKDNLRLATAYQTLARFSSEKKKKIQEDAARFLKSLE